MKHPEKWTFDWFYSRLKPHKGDVYRPGQALPEPGYETATGRRLYTVQQIRAAYAQGAKDSRSSFSCFRCVALSCTCEREKLGDQCIWRL